MPAHRYQTDEQSDDLEGVDHALPESHAGGLDLLKNPHFN
jgi:hypothetical protein